MPIIPVLRLHKTIRLTVLSNRLSSVNFPKNFFFVTTSFDSSLQHQGLRFNFAKLAPDLRTDGFMKISSPRQMKIATAWWNNMAGPGALYMYIPVASAVFKIIENTKAKRMIPKFLPL